MIGIGIGIRYRYICMYLLYLLRVEGRPTTQQTTQTTQTTHAYRPTHEYIYRTLFFFIFFTYIHCDTRFLHYARLHMSRSVGWMIFMKRAVCFYC